MAYVPDFGYDLFISYAHADDFAWIERLKSELEIALSRKLRASSKLSIFFDNQKLRVGRVIDTEISASLNASVFFLAIVSQRYNASDYCRREELTQFLRRNPPESGRTIQIQIDSSAELPLPESLAISFVSGKSPLNAGSGEYEDSLRRVYEPIVHELDRLYAQSKMIYLAWPAERELKEERTRLHSEIEGRGLRVYPGAIAEFESDIRFRDALQESAASVHFLGLEKDDFADRQFRLAAQVAKPLILASRNRAELRAGPAGSPPPIFVDQGNPTIAIANALDTALGRGRRDERELTTGLGKTGLFLVFKPDADGTLGLRLRQRIVNRGPFHVLEPRLKVGASDRYEELSRAKGAVLCWAKAGKNWLEDELDVLNGAVVSGKFYDFRRAIYLKSPGGTENIELVEGDRILRSDAELDAFLAELQPQGAGAVA
jgi:hypothetical protein